MKRLFIVFLLTETLVLFGLPIRGWAATTSTFLPDADARVKEATATTNYGTGTTLQADAGTGVNVESYLKFTVSGLSGTIQSAKLRLLSNSDGTADGPAAYSTTNTWTETGINWSNRPAKTSGPTDDKGAIGANTWTEWNVTPLVTGNGTFSFVLNTGSTDGVYFLSKEGGSPPQLVVTTDAGGGSDTQPPTAPILSGSAPTPNRVDLSWSGATDNVGITEYDVFRGSTQLATLGGTASSYSDTTVAPSSTYTYTVYAKDGAGNTSPASNTVSITTPTGGGSSTVTANADADAQVKEASPGTNYGTITSMLVDAGSGAGAEAYLHFTVSGLSGTVQSAKLRVFATTNGTADGPAAYGTSNSWTESGINWNNRPAKTSGPNDDKGSIPTNTWIEWNVTPLVTGNGAFSFVLSQPGTDGVVFSSREGTSAPQLVVTSSAGGGSDTQPPTAPTALTATAVSGNQVNLSWNASTDNVGVAFYDVFREGSGVGSAPGSTTTFSDTTVSPGQTYHYTVKARDAANNVSPASNSATATTPAGGDPVIAVAGDIACANNDPNFGGGDGTTSACRQKWTSNILLNGGFAAVLPLGDNQYNSGSLSQYNAVYEPTWGRLKNITYPVVGNHEYGQSGASGFFTYFGQRGSPQDTNCTSNCKGYYSLDVGTWHLIALNTNNNACGSLACGAGSAQETWLKQDLAAHKNACILAFDHHARWSSGHDGDNTFVQAIWQDLYDARAEILLSGHSHDYERFAPQNATGGLDNAAGVRQFVVGTGGAFFTGLGTRDVNSQASNNNTFGIMKLTLHPNSYDWQFVNDPGSGSFTDSGTTACH